jgi:hypothetical protein
VDNSNEQRQNGGLDRFQFYQLRDKYRELGKEHVLAMDKLEKLQAKNLELRQLVKVASPCMEYLHSKLPVGSVAFGKYKTWNEKAKVLGELE